MTLPAGTRLGSYEISSLLGKGGMGEVYQATDTRLGREVAIKVLPAEVAADSERLRRFEREAKVLGSLNHPAIATLHGFERHGDTHFLVMELVGGETLAERIARGPLSIEEALDTFLQIADGLEVAHRQGIVHRDLKPANIKLGAGRGSSATQVKILDFGLAKALVDDPAPGDASLTASPTLTLAATMRGEILGTAAYMAPEQAEGEPVDKRADIWAFGVCLWEALTGRRLFPGDKPSRILAAVLTEEPDFESLSPATPTALRRLLKRCLVKDPEARLHDIGDARLELNAALEGDDEELETAVSPGSNRLTIWAAVAVSAALASALTWVLTSNRQPQATERPITSLEISLPRGHVVTDAPAISPDGRTIAWAARDESGDEALYLRDLESFDSRRVGGGLSLNAFPFFSPDGAWVAYFADGKLMKAAVAGGQPSEVCPAPSPFGGVWLPDDTILFTPDLGSGIHRVPATGSRESEPITSVNPPSTYAHVWPQLLPDGRILFSAWGQDYGAYVLSQEAGSWNQILADNGGARYMPTGHLLTLGEVLGEVRAGRWNLETDEIEPPQTAVLDGVFETWNDQVKWMAVSPDGTLVYVPGDAASHRLTWFSRDGTFEPIDTAPGAYNEVYLSPDGRQLSFQENFSIWVLDLERGTRIRLVDEPGVGANESGNWSPDGKQLLVSSNTRGDWDLYTIASDGAGGLQPWLAKEGAMGSPDLAPDGTLLFSHRGDRSLGLWVVRAGDEPEIFLDEDANEDYPVLSPDGRLVAYTSDQVDRSEVYVTTFPDASTRIKISTDGGWRPRWSPSGDELFYERRGDLMSARFDGDRLVAGKPEVVAEAGLIGITPFDVAPDGRRFVGIRQDPDQVPNRIRVVFNWLDELERRVPVE